MDRCSLLQSQLAWRVLTRMPGLFEGKPMPLSCIPKSGQAAVAAQFCSVTRIDAWQAMGSGQPGSSRQKKTPESTFTPQILGQNPHGAQLEAQGSSVSSGDCHDSARRFWGVHPGLAPAPTAPALPHLPVGARGETVNIEAAAATPDFICSGRGGGRQRSGRLSLVENTLPGNSSSHFLPSPPT